MLADGKRGCIGPSRAVPSMRVVDLDSSPATRNNSLDRTALQYKVALGRWPRTRPK